MALVDSYLADRHVTGRAGPRLRPRRRRKRSAASAREVRRAVSRRIKELIGLVERQFPDWGKSAAHEKAMAIVPCMVGALMLARAVDDPQLSKAIRKAARELIRSAAG